MNTLLRVLSSFRFLGDFLLIMIKVPHMEGGVHRTQFVMRDVGMMNEIDLTRINESDRSKSSYLCGFGGL